ncbi:MAG TPA: Do family serine endopeptidase [Rhizomicrobium sp.]|jgi:serine protease Do|nr:Do family serine endopeptidase [Rhizomicrobium sp.]
MTRSFFASHSWRGALAGLVALALPLILPPQAAVARGAPDSFADLAGQLLPMVVNISTTQTLKASSADNQLPNIPPGSPLEDLFKDFLKQNNMPRHVTSLGSGFIIDPSGLIVTNNHVIADADQITVTLNDGTSLPAKLVGRDEKTDLALLRVKPVKPLPSTHWGDSDKARVGDWVIAIGNPFGLGSTVTAGIVSARNRDINAGPYDDFIQTDAPINRGNSGGPLFDMDGNVVGVNSEIYSPSGGSVGIGFSIPSNLVRDVTGQLRQFGVTHRGMIGVRVQQLTDDLAEGMSLPNSHGALVAGVTANGPAGKAGVQNGDVIVGFDGKPIPDSRALPRIVADTPVGKSVGIDFIRKGKKMSATLVVAKLQDDTAAAAKKPPAPPVKPGPKVSGLGLTLAQLDADARTHYHIGGDVKGVLVTDVDPDGPAADRNMRPGDVIVEVQNQAVNSPGDITKRVDADTKAGKKVELMLVNRGGNLTFVALKLGSS